MKQLINKSSLVERNINRLIEHFQSAKSNRKKYSIMQVIREEQKHLANILNTRTA